MTDEDLKTKMYDFGALKYSGKRMASILSVSVDEINRMLEGECGTWYSSGLDVYEYHVDKKLMEMSISGDIKALAELKKRKSQRG